jgi:predicted nucleotidyltransferase
MKKSNLLKENEERAIRSLKKILSEKFDLVEIRLFGSKARGESTPDSDMDVMIEIVESNPYVRFGIYDVIFEINLENDTFISASIFSKKEIEDGPMGESPLYKIIHKEGIPI